MVNKLHYTYRKLCLMMFVSNTLYNQMDLFHISSQTSSVIFCPDCWILVNNYPVFADWMLAIILYDEVSILVLK